MKTLITFISLFVIAFPLFANLCNPKHIKTRHINEADELVSEMFSQGDYLGAGADYDSQVIACNRKRDTLKSHIEKRSSGFVFEQTLSGRYIKGKISYYGLAPMKYGYKLSRKNGIWYVTVAGRFHFPKHKFKKKLDIPMQLASELGIANTICSKTQRSLGKITRGYVNAGYGDRILNACRVKRDEKFNGVVITTHLMRFWKRYIVNYWSHRGFVVDFKIVNLNELSSRELNNYEDKKIVWEIRMNHNKTSRAMYRASIGRSHPLYAGTNEYIIRHEFGHMLGLDDEYHEKDKVPDWKKCEDNGGIDYIMCNSWGSDMKDVKGVYPWIVSRRY